MRVGSGDMGRDSGGKGSQIPVAVRRRPSSTDSLGGPQSPPPNTVAEMSWKQRYDLTDAKRKDLIQQFLKATREKEELEKSLNQLKMKTTALERQLEEQKKEEGKLRSLSEDMVKEYDELQKKYVLDTGALQEAVNRATQWYTQNKKLKRRSAVLMEEVMKSSQGQFKLLDSAIDEQDSAGDIADEIQTLRNSEQELRNQVASLQAELNSLRLQEFEAQEQVIELSAALDAEKQISSKLSVQVKELEIESNNLSQVARLAAQEVTSLREQYEKERSSSEKFKSDADQAKKERNVLAHQSQILMYEAASDEKLMKALLEIETLKRSLEDEKIRHCDDVQQLKEQLENHQNESQLEFMDEKLKLVESELKVALERAQRAEEEMAMLKAKVGESEQGPQSAPSVVPPPPPPLPPCIAMPPPPPPPPPKPRVKNSSVLEMANLLGVPRANKPTLQQGAIDDIINEIKGGKFLLKTPDKPERKKIEEEQPPALKEMMNVLGTLRRRPGNRTPSFKRSRNELSATQNTADILI